MYTHSIGTHPLLLDLYFLLYQLLEVITPINNLMYIISTHLYYSNTNLLNLIMQIDENTTINVLNYLKRLDSFPNAYIAYKILLTVHVMVASVERSFLKLKLIKSYLRFTMSQERLSGLAILSIEKENVRGT